MPIDQRKTQLPREAAKAIVFVALGMLICWWVHSNNKPEDPWLSGGVVKVEKEVDQVDPNDPNQTVTVTTLVGFMAPDATMPEAQQWFLMQDDPPEQFPVPFQVDDRIVLTRLADPLPVTMLEFCQKFSTQLPGAPTVIRTIQSGAMGKWECP